MKNINPQNFKEKKRHTSGMHRTPLLDDLLMTHDFSQLPRLTLPAALKDLDIMVHHPALSKLLATDVKAKAAPPPQPQPPSGNGAKLPEKRDASAMRALYDEYMNLHVGALETQRAYLDANMYHTVALEGEIYDQGDLGYLDEAQTAAYHAYRAAYVRVPDVVAEPAVVPKLLPPRVVYTAEEVASLEPEERSDYLAYTELHAAQS